MSFCRSGGPWARPFPSCTSRGGWLTAAVGSSERKTLLISCLRRFALCRAAIHNDPTGSPISQGQRMKIQWKFSAALCLVVTLSLASIAQTAAVPAMTTLSADERDVALKSLQATQDAFLKSIAGLSE